MILRSQRFQKSAVCAQIPCLFLSHMIPRCRFLSPSGARDRGPGRGLRGFFQRAPGLFGIEADAQPLVRPAAFGRAHRGVFRKRVVRKLDLKLFRIERRELA